MVVAVVAGVVDMVAVWAEETVRIEVETTLSTLDQMTMEIRMVIIKAGRIAVEGMGDMEEVDMAVEEGIPILKTHINPDLIKVSLRPIHMVEVVMADMVDTAMVVEGVQEEAIADMEGTVATRDHREGHLKMLMVAEADRAMVHLRHLP